MPKNKALIILEQPWWDLAENPEQASVLPFLQGLDRVLPKVRTYHATFFDLASFDSALQHLASVKEENAIIYIASHGCGGRIGGVNLSKMLERIGEYSKSWNIEGCLLGACEVGGRSDVMKAAMVGSRMAWVAGYGVSVGWLPSTLLDLNILYTMSQLREKDLCEADQIEAAFGEALSLFNGNFFIGAKVKGDTVTDERLRDSFTLITKPRGSGHRPSDSTFTTAEAAWPETSDE